VDLLRRALDPRRRRKRLPRAYVFVGGGVNDAYQPLEEKYRLTRGALEVIERFRFPVHLLTKSSLAERDFDILERIATHDPVIVSMSFSTVDDEVAAVFEPGASRPSVRLRTLVRARERGFATAMYLMPVIPEVTDGEACMRASVHAARDAGAAYVMFGGMTLKGGRQQQHFGRVLHRYNPDLVATCLALYGNDTWGSPRRDYYREVETRFAAIADAAGVPQRAPARLLRGALDENDVVVVILENIDHLLRLRGRHSAFGRAAQSVAALQSPLSAMRSQLRTLRGVGPAMEREILEVLDTGTCSLHESLMAGR
jgi:DNA repair photolyase